MQKSRRKRRETPWGCGLTPKNIRDKDPAARNTLEVVLLYPGFHVLVTHRIAHFLYRHRLMFLARLVSQLSRHLTGIEIHPGGQDRPAAVH